MRISPLLASHANCCLAQVNAADLVVHEDVHHVVIHFLSDPAFWSPWEQDKFDAKQRNKNQCCSHCLHVQVGFCLVGVFQLGYENTNNI